MKLINLCLLLLSILELVRCSRHVIVTGSSNIVINGIYSCKNGIDNENIQCKTYQLTNNKSFRIDIMNILRSDNSIVRHWYIISEENKIDNKIYGSLEMNREPLLLKTWKNLNTSQYESDMKLDYINSTSCDINIRTEVDHNIIFDIARSIWMIIDKKGDINSPENDDLRNCIVIFKRIYHQIESRSQKKIERHNGSGSENESTSKAQLSWSLKVSLTSLCDHWIYEGDWESGSNCYDFLILNDVHEGDIVPSSLVMTRLRSMTIASIDHLPLACWGSDFLPEDILSCLIFAQFTHYSFHVLLNTAQALKTMHVLDKLQVFFETKNYKDMSLESDLMSYPASLLAVSQYLSGLPSDVEYASSEVISMTGACSLLQKSNIISHDRFKQLYELVCSTAKDAPTPISMVPSSEYGIVVSLLGIGAVEQTAIFLRNQYSYKNNINIFNYEQIIQNTSKEFLKTNAVNCTIIDLSELVSASPNLRAAFLLQSLPDIWFVESWVSLDAFLQLCAPVVLSTSDTREPLILRRLIHLRLKTIHSYCKSTHDCKFTIDGNQIGVRGLFLLAYQGIGQNLHFNSNMTSMLINTQYHDADWDIPQQFLGMFDSSSHNLVERKKDEGVDEGIEQSRLVVHIGFLSSFFRRHSVGRLLSPLIDGLSHDMGTHDRKMICNDRDNRRVKVDGSINNSTHNNSDILLCVHVIAIDGLNVDTFDPKTIGKKDDIRDKLKKSDAIWHSLSSQAADVLAQQIKTLDLDVVVFGDIFLDSTTAYLSTYRVATYQIAFWGHPYTSGTTAIDYFISSIYFEEKLISEGPIVAKFRENQFVEQLVLFDTLGFAFESDESVNGGQYSKTINTVTKSDSDALPPKTKEQRSQYLCWLASRSYDIHGHSLKNMMKCKDDNMNVVVYTCLQTLMKMHPSFDEVIIRLLERKPDALIVLSHSSTQVVWQRSLRSRLLQRVGKTKAKNIIFVNQMPHHDYVRAICGGDVTLDPFPFGGGVTMIDSLACDPPVRFVTSSHLQTVHGLASGFAHFLNLSDSMTANTINGYVDMVINNSISTSTSKSDQYSDTNKKIVKTGIGESLLKTRQALYEKTLVQNEWKEFIRTLTI